MLSFSICLGIAVDDTIHFLSKYRREVAEDNCVEAAVRRSIDAITPALLTTTALMLTGFAAGFASTMPTMHAFASYSCVALGLALASDLLMLPSLLVSFPRAGGRP